jgi:Holliday junction resolvase RusA-like endonuclease
MSKPLFSITVPGQPVGKGRPRVTIKGHMFTPEKTARYENLLALAAQEAMGGLPPLDGPLSLVLKARMAVPSSWSQKKRAAALDGSLMPIGRPDLDNIIKVVDGFAGIVWTDDSRIVEITASKVYSDTPALVVEVRDARDLFA